MYIMTRGQQWGVAQLKRKRNRKNTRGILYLQPITTNETESAILQEAGESVSCIIVSTVQTPYNKMQECTTPV